MSPKQYEAFTERMRQSHVAHHCKYGHLDCSDRDGGPCCDEEYPEAWRREDEAAMDATNNEQLIVNLEPAAPVQLELFPV